MEDSVMRKGICFAVGIVLAVLMALMPACALDRGDVDGNGKVTAADARLVLRVAAKLDSFSSEQTEAGDIDGNGKISASDARAVLRVAAKLDSFTEKPNKDSELSASDVYKLANTYTVEIRAESYESVSTGSGFFISSDGKIVTNYHVIDSAFNIFVIDYDGNEYPVEQVLAADEDIDLAVLKINTALVDYAELEKSDYSTGDKIYALGSSRGLTGTFTDGIISTRSRQIDGYEYIQITAPITHGNSGGPLIDAYGRVIGVNTWIFADGQNLNFAVPIKMLDSLDYSKPFVPSERGSYAPLELTDADGLSFLGEYENGKLKMKKGGTAFLVILPTQYFVGEKITVNYDTKYVEVEWSDWYTDRIILYVSCLEYGSCELTIFPDDFPDRAISCTIEIGTSGFEDYFGDPGVPDFGAYFGVPSTSFYISDDINYTSLDYPSEGLLSRYGSVKAILEEFGTILGAYGFGGYTHERSEELSADLYFFNNTQSGITLAFEVFFKEGTNDIISFGISYLYS